MADIVLVNPRFEVSYWGLEYALPLLGKRCNMPTACLPLLAALTPAEHRVTLVDENVEPIDFDRLARADLVGLTGMSVQRHRMREILTELKRRGVFTVVGGPWVTVDEDYFDGLADAIFIGEAEQTWPRFLADWQSGRHAYRYEQTEKTELMTVPLPRYELMKMRHYLFGSIQFSRGCPFQCEFCDIIVTFGRRPRIKTSAQVIAELEALRAAGVHIAFIVDDNLIGNKKAIKLLLADVAAWQQAHGYPFTFFTEASLDLADDDELMQSLVEANITCVFIGIESPNEASLRETKKLQNLRAGGTIVDRVRCVQDAGLEVWCGMIVGFDHDRSDIFAAQSEFLRQTDIVHAMIGMLSAIPKTPLYARLQNEGRLDRSDDPEFGTNVIPLGMSREELREGYVRLMEELYSPEAYFGRFEELYLNRRFNFGRARNREWRRRPWLKWRSQSADAIRCVYLYRQLMHGVAEPALRAEYRRRLWHFLRRRADPNVLFIALIKCAMHYHHYTMARQMAARRTVVNTY